MSKLITTTGVYHKARSEQKCWGCKWASGLPTEKTGRPCPWSLPDEERKPVEGWTATIRIKNSIKFGYSVSYDLKESDFCPLFEEDDPSLYKIHDPRRPWSE